MAMSNSMAYNIIRILFIIFNFLGIGMGIAMVAIGAYLYISKGDVLNLLPDLDNVNITAVMIAAGIIVFVISFIGFCGAWMESQCMLIVFFLSIFIIFALEIAVGIVGFIYRNDIDEGLNAQLKKGLKDKKRKVSWDLIQKQFKCCGVDTFQDWYDDSSASKKVPDSCCSYTGCGLNPGQSYDIGCYTKVKEAVEDNYYKLGAAGIALGVLQILLMVMTMVLICAIRRYRMKV